MRAVIENLILFFIPSLLYFGWLILARPNTLKKSPDESLDALRLINEAPLFWLGLAGLFLIVVVLVSFGSSSGGKPGQHYHPPVYKDGHIVPGNIE